MAREDPERAIELDSDGAEGYLALAWIQINRYSNWECAEISLNKAAELEPGSASLLRYRSFLSHSLGRLNEAIAYHQQAIAIDPLFASSYSYLAFLLYCTGDYAKAEAAARKALSVLRASHCLEASLSKESISWLVETWEFANTVTATDLCK